MKVHLHLYIDGTDKMVTLEPVYEIQQSEHYTLFLTSGSPETYLNTEIKGLLIERSVRQNWRRRNESKI